MGKDKRRASRKKNANPHITEGEDTPSPDTPKATETPAIALPSTSQPPPTNMTHEETVSITTEDGHHAQVTVKIDISINVRVLPSPKQERKSTSDTRPILAGFAPDIARYAGFASDDTMDVIPPVFGGMKIIGEGGSGTVTIVCRAMPENSLFLLTAGHVVGATVPTEIENRPLGQTSMVTLPDGPTVTMVKTYCRRFGLKFDAALIAVNADLSSSVGKVMIPGKGIISVSNNFPMVTKDMRVVHAGKKSGGRKGIIVSSPIDNPRIDNRFVDGGTSSPLDLFCIQGDNDEVFAVKGDSGGAILLEDTNEMVGMLVAADDTFAYGVAMMGFGGIADGLASEWQLFPY